MVIGRIQLAMSCGIGASSSYLLTASSGLESIFTEYPPNMASCFMHTSTEGTLESASNTEVTMPCNVIVEGPVPSLLSRGPCTLKMKGIHRHEYQETEITGHHLGVSLSQTGVSKIRSPQSISRLTSALL